MNDPRYPIGKFDNTKTDWQLEELLEAVVNIQSMPNELAKLLKDITPEQLAKTYRDGGWNVQQIVHHMADSHMNAWIRTKLVLTEDNPAVKPYKEKLWAEGKDYSYHYEASYVIIVALHQRWSLLLLECLKNPETLLRTYYHPESERTFTLAQLIALYGWHSKHHLEHIRAALSA